MCGVRKKQGSIVSTLLFLLTSRGWGRKKFKKNYYITGKEQEDIVIAMVEVTLEHSEFKDIGTKDKESHNYTGDMNQPKTNIYEVTLNNKEILVSDAHTKLFY